MKIKALKKNKSYRYRLNRKRINKNLSSVGTIKCPEIRKEWNERKTMERNLFEMGLSRDSNQTLNIPRKKQKQINLATARKGFYESDILDTVANTISAGNNDTVDDKRRSKKYVIDNMEADANALRQSEFRLPKGVVKYASYLLDTHGLNYKAMVRDDKNYDQETWRQFRAKLRKFMSIPDHFNVYLSERNLTVDQLNWEEFESDDEIF